VGFGPGHQPDFSAAVALSISSLVGTMKRTVRMFEPGTIDRPPAMNDSTSSRRLIVSL